MGIQPGSAVDAAAGACEASDSALLHIFGEKSRVDTDSWISDS